MHALTPMAVMTRLTIGCVLSTDTENQEILFMH